jgi:hypothetical protein
VRPASDRDTRAVASANRMELVATTRNSSLSSSRSRADALHPYSAGSESARDDREFDGASRFSTWRDEPQQPAPIPRASATPQSHNYYPTLRSGVYAAQPVTLTARQGAFFPGTCSCTASRGHLMAGVGHHR